MFQQKSRANSYNTARTYPANGKFTPAQAALYTAVLKAQKYLITLCTESACLSLAQIHRESCQALRKELNQIGFNLNGVSGAGDLERILYPHYVGHPLGIGACPRYSRESYLTRARQTYTNRLTLSGPRCTFTLYAPLLVRY